MKNKLNPLIYDVIDENNIGDNVVLFYFAALIKETLKEMKDRNLKEAILRFILDE